MFESSDGWVELVLMLGVAGHGDGEAAEQRADVWVPGDGLNSGVLSASSKARRGHTR